MKYLEYAICIGSNERSLVAIDRFQLAQGEITFLFGESGIGKSLIAKAIYGLLDPAELTVEINGKEYPEYIQAHRVQLVKKNGFFVFQEPSSHLNPLLTLSEQIREGDLAASGQSNEVLSSLWNPDAATSTAEILRVYPRPHRPSGGEKQRLLIAMAFNKMDLISRNDTALFVFDEPSGSLDDQARNLFLHLLFTRYARRPFTLLLITHDYSMISEVYRHNAELLPRIHFKELARRGDELIERDFAADTYLAWLTSIRRTQITSSAVQAIEKKVIIHVQSDYQIFGRRFQIFKDTEYRQPVDLVVHKGEMIYLKAPSGAGKTTLAKIIAGLHRAEKLRAHLFGQPINERTPQKFWRQSVWGKQLSMVFQHADEALNLQSTVKGVLAGIKSGRLLSASFKETAINDLFDEEDGDGFLKKKVAHLSGGQKQRLNLLRSFFLDVDLLILDEPLNGLDFASIKKTLDLIERKRTEGVAFFVISHNEEIFESIIDPEHIFYLKS